MSTSRQTKTNRQLAREIDTLRNLVNRGKNQQRKRSNRRKKTAARTTRGIDPYEAMIEDPCNSTLVPGLYGASEGMLARLKSTWSSAQTFSVDPATATCGYVLWCPEYSCAGAQPVFSEEEFGNLFAWTNSLPTARPANTTALAYGRNQVGSCQSLPDPASNLIHSDIVADCRPLNACIQMTYYGKMLDSAGEVAVISNLPFSELIGGGPGGEPLSVNELLVYSTSKHRLGVETREAIFRPSEDISTTFRGEDDPLTVTPYPTGVGHESTEANTVDPVVFGFVWRNTEAGAGISFDFTKSIEWRPDATSGLTQVPVQHIGPSHVTRVLKKLDSKHKRGHPVWDRIVGGFNQVANLGMRALGGNTLNMIGTNIKSSATSAVMAGIEEIAPYALAVI